MPNLKNDRRSQRTQRTIHEALMSLLQEKRYDAITVQDIIDRADVGRSTFYAHYQDKEDLMSSLLVHLMDVLSQMPGRAAATNLERLIPARDIFEHVQQNLDLFKGMVRGRGLELFFEKGQDYWSEKIAAALQEELPAGQTPAVPIPVTAHFVAGSFVTILRWWLDNKMPYSPQEMDQIVQRLLMPGIRNSL
jgi:AcrR family transcriptional regulator